MATSNTLQTIYLIRPARTHSRPYPATHKTRTVESNPLHVVRVERESVKNRREKKTKHKSRALFLRVKTQSAARGTRALGLSPLRSADCEQSHSFSFLRRASGQRV